MVALSDIQLIFGSQLDIFTTCINGTYNIFQWILIKYFLLIGIEKLWV